MPALLQEEEFLHSVLAGEEQPKRTDRDELKLM